MFHWRFSANSPTASIRWPWPIGNGYIRSQQFGNSARNDLCFFERAFSKTQVSKVTLGFDNFWYRIRNVVASKLGRGDGIYDLCSKQKELAVNTNGYRKVYCVFHDTEELHRTLDAAERICPESEFVVLEFDETLFQRLPPRKSIHPSSCFMIGDDPSSRSRIPLIDQLSVRYPVIPSLLVSSPTDLVSSSSPLSSEICVYRPYSEDQLEQQIRRVFLVSDQRSQLISKSHLVERLSPREIEIVQLATEGVPNKTIAKRLDISIKTVEKNRRTAYEKLCVSSAAELASLITFHMFFSEPTFAGVMSTNYR